jgi:cardiolipin synthase
VTEAGPTNRILTLPNVVSFIRLLAVGYFWWLLLVDDNIPWAAWLVFIIGWTDWIDGYLARKLNQVSELGKVLDPVADRLMIASAVIGGLIVGVLPPVIGWGLIARELFMAAVTLYLMSQGGSVLDVRYLGKVSTTFLYGSIPAFYLAAAGVAEGFMRPVAWFFGVLGLILYWVVAFQYVGDAREKLSELKSRPDPEEV